MLPGSVPELRAVWAADATHVFAVGDAGLILFFDGSSWKQQTSPVADKLKAVHGSSPTDVFAVGNQGSILHYDGSAWSQVRWPANFLDGFSKDAVIVRPDEVVIAGSGAGETYALRRTGP